MPNPATISITPRMISQMPATSAKVTIESNGHASTTMPARMLMMPKKIEPTSAGKRWIADGRCGCRDAAEDESDRNPDGQQQNCVPLPEVAKRQHGKDHRRRG